MTSVCKEIRHSEVGAAAAAGELVAGAAVGGARPAADEGSGGVPGAARAFGQPCVRPGVRRSGGLGLRLGDAGERGAAAEDVGAHQGFGPDAVAREQRLQDGAVFGQRLLEPAFRKQRVMA